MVLVGGDRRQWLLLGHELDELPEDDIAQQRSTTEDEYDIAESTSSDVRNTATQEQSNYLATNLASQLRTRGHLPNLGTWSVDLEEITGSRRAENPDSVPTLRRHQGISELYRTASNEFIDPHTFAKPQTSNYIGWRAGVRLCFLASIGCFVFEIILLIVSMRLGGDSAIGTLMAGSCTKVKRLTFWLLLPLNIIGTVLIASTNYVMQCLCAPNRKEVDLAHKQKTYVNIGTPSIRNLWRVSQLKSGLWLLLGLSSIPIHLFLNSAIFSSLQANDYSVVVVASDFLEDKTWDKYCNNDTLSYSGTFACRTRTAALQGFHNHSTIDAGECVRRYGSSLQSTSSNVVLITDLKDKSLQWPSITAPVAACPPKVFNFNESLGVASLATSLLGFTVPKPIQQAVNHVSLNGTFVPTQDPLFEIDSFYTIFGAFDYRYWTSMELIDYNFADSRVPMSLRWDPTSWMCPVDSLLSGRGCDSKSLDARNWTVTPRRIPIDRCISFPGIDRCRLQYSQTMLSIIVICDAIKVATMLIILRYALRTSIEHAPLVTLGDAIDSFLREPDTTTRGMCLTTRRECRSKNSSTTGGVYSLLGMRKAGQSLNDDEQLRQRLNPPDPRRGTTWRPLNHRWKDVSSASRWGFLILWIIVLLSITSFLLRVSLESLQSKGITNIWSQGIGTIDPNAIFTSKIFTSQNRDEDRLLATTILLNLPQLFFSLLYFLYNGMMTCMLAGREWSSFATRPKALRVSRPEGLQRSTYWLSLPWRYSVPLILITAGTHWLISRSLFIVSIDAYDRDGYLSLDRSVSACGFSPLAIILVLTTLIVLPLLLFLLSLRRLNPNIPMVGTCSFAISAACHLAPSQGTEVEERNPALKHLMWGVTRKATRNSPGHCSLSTSKRLRRPKEGLPYM